MNTYNVSELKAGMKFTSPLYIEGDTLFVPKMVPIKQREIDRLKKWNITTVYGEGEPYDPESAEASGSNNILDAVFESEDYRKIISFYKDLSERMAGIYGAIRRRERITTDTIDQVVDGLNGELRVRRDELVQYILYGLQGESSFEQNALNSAALSILIARQMSMTEHKILELATAALTHDIGMLRLPEEVVNKSGQLTGEELQQIKTHPIHSYKILVRELGYPDAIGQAALQHQERWDGTGYPRGLKGQKIAMHARIIAVADAFEAMISKRPYRDSMIGYRAMRTILGDNGRRFDPEILKVFIRTMGLYPLGSVVLLNNSAVGRVIAVNESAPLRPKVKIMIDETGSWAKDDSGDTIDLSKEKQLFIVRAIDPKDLRSDPNAQSNPNAQSQKGSGTGQ